VWSRRVERATIAGMQTETFIAGWNALDRAERKRLRRLVRLGRPIDEPKLELLADGYAQFQMARPWMRFFWLWFVPGVLIALSIASQMHPLMVGVVLALSAQAVIANRNLRRRSVAASA
jgi:hypothetical protein